MENKREELVRRLVALIQGPEGALRGQLPPERELAHSLGVSRNLLREALVTLETLGVLEIRERQGLFVRDPGGGDYAASLRFLSLWPQDILTHLMEMRLLVEVPASGLAATRRTEEELGRMRECVEHLRAVHDTPDCAPSGAAWDSLLHAQVIQAARNPVLSRVYEGLSSTMERYIVTSRTLLLALEGWGRKVLEQHRLIVEGLGRRDPEATMRAVREHLEGALLKLSELRGSPRTGEEYARLFRG